MDAETIQAVAQEYLNAAHTPEHPSYSAFVRETLAQYDALLAAGWTFERVESEPYADSNAMLADCQRRTLRVFTGGNEFGPEHPLAVALPTGWTVNEVFRAVHDVYGHAAYNGGIVCAFETFEGETQAYLNHKASYSPDARPALYGETMGQLCHYFSGRGFASVQYCRIIPVML